MKTIFDELKQEVKNWWVSLILGILYVAVALGLSLIHIWQTYSSPIRQWPYPLLQQVPDR